MLQRVARTCYHRRWAVVVAWVVLLAGLNGLNQAAGGTFRDEFDLPGSESQDAFDLLEERGFPNLGGFSGQLVVATEAEGGVLSPEVAGFVTRVADEIEASVPDTEVVDPYGPGGERLVSEGGDIAYAEIDLADRESPEFTEAGETIREIVADARDVAPAGTQVELGGDIFVEPAEFSSEVVGIGAAVIILLVAFGSVLAMGLPILTALFGIGCGIALVGLVVNLITMPTFSNQAVAMIGIGVGIDYALFIVTRYRESLAAGLGVEEAVVRAIDTAGRAVLFAGLTVVIAILGLFTVGLAMVNGLAVGVSVGVLLTMLASLTLLPAVLGFVGTNIDRLGLPWRRRGHHGGEGSTWYRWSRLIQRRPWPALVVGAVGLLVLTVPLSALRLGFGDASNRPESDTTRRAFDLISEGFGPGANGPLQLAVDMPGGPGDLPAAEELAAGVGRVDGVDAASPPIPNEAGDAAVVIAIPDSAPQDEATSELVHRLRDDAVPELTAGTDLRVLVGGQQAAVVDFAEFTGDRLPWFIAAVLVLSFLLLMLVFRSLLVPLKAVIMNLLSVGASYGVIVAVFQWGWGAGLLGLGEPGPIEAWVPMMMFAVIFGLSMDYEVFLLSRIREDYDRTGDNATAVANGLTVTARVITAAALIMFCVFGSFVLNEERALNLFGLGLAVAVLLDATVVRLVLVPATMELLGDRNWWLPRRLDRVLPVVHVEAADDDTPTTRTPRRGPGA